MNGQMGRRLWAYVAVVLCCLGSVLKGEEQTGGEKEYDVIIRGGRIVDGTGNPWYFGDVGVRGEEIVAIGRNLGEKAKRVVEARGKVVAPGFIDIHSHSDFLLLEDGSAQSKIRQGVTTEILGEGESAGPYVEKLTPRVVKISGQETSWRRLGGYFDAVERAGSSVNVASYVGLDTVWQCVMGTSHARPSEAEFRQMQQIIEEAMQDGALGLSSQLMMPPGSLATTDDLIALCEPVSRHGGIFSSHIHNEGTGVIESVRQAIEVGEKAELPVDIIHLKIADQKFWGRMEEIVKLIEEARGRGIPVQANVYPYTRGNNDLASIIPPWAHEGGKVKMLERLRDPAERAKMKQDIVEGLPEWYNHYLAVGGDWSRMLVSGNNSLQGLTMDRVMSVRTQNKMNQDLIEELFDILIENDGSVPTVFAHHTEEDMQTALVQEWCSVGSDGSAYAIEGRLRRGHPHPRNFGTFPRVLGVYVREQKRLGLEDAIRKMTSLNATKVGLERRGLLVSGFYADVTIFDPETIIDRSTFSEPFQYGEGIEYVMVNGQIVLDRGVHTGARPGRGLRKGTGRVEPGGKALQKP